MQIGFKIVQRKLLPGGGEEEMGDYIRKCFHGCSSKGRRGDLFTRLSSFASHTIAAEFITIITARRQCFFLIGSFMSEKEVFLHLS